MKLINRPLETISQFAKLCGTTRQTLQYYDKIGLLKPAYTGEQGYRYYNSAQRYDFQMITTLKQTGCSLEEIKEITGSRGRNQIFHVLTEKKHKLEIEAKRIAMSRVFLDYTIKFLGMVAANTDEKPRIIELNQYVGIIKYALKEPARIGSSELGKELNNFNIKFGANELIQQYPYGYVIPKSEYINGSRLVTHIICMSHDYDSGELPEIVPQGAYIMLQKNIFADYKNDRNEAYSIIEEYLRENRLEVCGDTYEIPADIPEFMRSSDHFHVIIMVRVKKAEDNPFC